MNALTWRDVLDCKIEARFKDNYVPFRKDKFVEHAITLGYRFIAWNGDIYFIDSDKKVHNLGLKATNL